MRRNERNITDFNERIEVLKKCRICSVAFFDKDFPYILPLSFGFIEENQEISLYFHCAHTGKKLELLKSNPHVAFSTNVDCKIIRGDLPCDTGMLYHSICANGIMEVITDREEKVKALKSITKQYTFVGHIDTAQLQEKGAKSQEPLVASHGFLEHEFSTAQLDSVTILRMKVNEFTGKRHL